MELQEIQQYLEENINRASSKKMLIEIIEKKIKIDPPENLNKNIILDILCAITLYKRIKIPTLLGMFYKYCKNNNIEEYTQLLCDHLGYLCSIYTAYVDFDRSEVITNITLDPEEKKVMDAFMYPLPLVVEPKTIHKNSNTGYHYSDKGSIMLRDKPPKEDLNIDFINIINKIPLKITSSKEVLQMEPQWKHCDFNEGEVDQKRFNFTLFKNNFKDLVFKYSQFSKFYLTWKYDHRGRSYSQGYYINIQGIDIQKASIELAEPEKLKD